MTGREEWEEKLNNRLSLRIAKCPMYIQGYYASLLDMTPASKETYLSLVVKSLKTINKEPMDISKNDILIFLSTLKRNDGKRLSDANKALTYSALKSFFDYLYDNDDSNAENSIQKNPMNRMNRPKVPKKHRDVYLTQEEVVGYIKNIDKRYHRWQERDMAIVQTLLMTGMRRAALLGLNIEDIDFEREMITITTKGNKLKTFKVPKLIPYLKRWVDIRNKQNNPDTHALFLSAPNKRLTSDTLCAILNRYTDGVTDKNITPHVFRHTFATLLYQKTGDIKLVKDLLGHENIETTLIYTNDDSDKTEMAGDIIAKMIASNSTKVEDLEFNIRECDILKNANINYVEQLIEMPLEQLFCIRNMGRRALFNIINTCVEHGYQFKDSKVIEFVRS